jgi:uncharacterized protein YbjT (DUF2867 family)
MSLLVKLGLLMTEPESKIALLAGASGFVGGFLLDALLQGQDFSRVIAITRRPLGREDSRLANRVLLFDKLAAQLQGLICHTAFCCLGTTIRTAGSEDAFRRVDFDYVLEFARVAKAAQAQRLVVVSSAAANAGSRNFYLRTKGEMEEAVTNTGFVSLDILEPGLLLGWRREMRPLEVVARVLMPLVNPLLFGPRVIYRGIPAQTVALAMVGAARSGRRGTYRYTYTGMLSLAKKGRTRGAL